MMLSTQLVIRTKRPWWERSLLIGGMSISIMSVFAFIAADGSGHETIAAVALLLLVAVMTVMVGFAVVTAIVKFWRKSPPEKMIALSEYAIFTGESEMPIETVRSIVIESDGYAGQFTPGEKYPHSGGGKLTVVENSGRELQWLLTIRSASEITQLRQLTAYWRSVGKTALMMD